MAESKLEMPVEAQIADLERGWADAFRKRDIPAIQRFLADGFSLIIAVQGVPLQVVPRDAWLESVERYEIDDLSIDQMYVRSYGEVAVAVLLWTQSARLAGEDRSAQFALTDIWVRQKGEWRVAARHSGRPEHVGAARPPAEPLTR